MANEKVDHRVLNILRWSMLIQVFFIAQSAFSARFYSLFGGKKPPQNLASLVPLLLVITIFILLSIKKVTEKITKRSLLIILFGLALLTIVSRHLSPGPPQGVLRGQDPRGLAQYTNNNRWEWGMIFFLVIPLVFIAWQYSMREVFIYCALIVFAEAVPLFLPGQFRSPFLTIMNLFSDISRSLVLGLVGWIENRLVTVQRDQQAQLVEANQKLRDYALTSEKLAQTQERNRLARELHDTLAHTLSSVSVQLEATKALFDRDAHKAKDMLDESIANTRSGLKETRRTLFDLRASELETLGLVQSIRNLGMSAAERAGFDINFDLDKTMDILPEDISHCLYRTAQEALENIVRHASAKNVSLLLGSEGGQLTLRIEDDGSGFSPEAIADEHLGLRGMRERVEMLGGDFKIESRPDKGTKITVIMERAYD